MKQPLYALLIAPDEKMREDILAGRKKITIRDGHRDYRPGPVLLACPGIWLEQEQKYSEPWAVMADITSIRHCLFCYLTREELLVDGFKNHQDALLGFQKYYPDIDLDSPVTVIRWQNVRGTLVEEYRVRQKARQ